MSPAMNGQQDINVPPGPASGLAAVASGHHGPQERMRPWSRILLALAALALGVNLWQPIWRST